MSSPTDELKVYDALIIGGGAGGLSTALTLGRLNRTALVFDSSEYRDAGAAELHAVLSREGTSPQEFRALSRTQIADKYPTIAFVDGTRIVAATPVPGVVPGHDGFELTDAQGDTYRGRKLVLAAGTQDLFPDIAGFAECWPRLITPCVLCDGFEYAHPRAFAPSDRPVGVLGFADGSQANHALMVWLLDPPGVTVFADGALSSAPELCKQAALLRARGTRFDERRITRLEPAPTGSGVIVHLEDGEREHVAWLVCRTPTVPCAKEVIGQLGLEVKDGLVVTSPAWCETSVAGVYAVGDQTRKMKQTVVAMRDGTMAGTALAMQIGIEIAQDMGKKAMRDKAKSRRRSGSHPM